MLDMAYIRALEVASFYFMFQLQPVGSVAHIQICGTTSCMICGAEDLVAVCREKIAERPHALSADGKFSWEEVECLGACANAPMAQIGKDYFEDLTTEKLAALIDDLGAGRPVQVGPQTGRFASEPAGGITTLTDYVNASITLNASAALAQDIGDTVKRIDGTEVPLHAPWTDQSGRRGDAVPEGGPDLSEGHPADATGIDKREHPADRPGRPPSKSEPAEASTDTEGAGAEPAPAPAAEPEAEPGAAPDHSVAAAGAHDARASAPGSASAAAAEGDESGEAERDEAGSEAGAEALGSAIDRSAEARPEALQAPRAGGADDLKRIKGIGPKLEQQLNALGFYHFDQIAGWSEAEVAWVDDNLEGFKGRVSRDEWVAQARSLADETKA
jgi:NADH-quinone oxidoreductase subunit E